MGGISARSNRTIRALVPIAPTGRRCTMLLKRGATRRSCAYSSDWAQMRTREARRAIRRCTRPLGTVPIGYDLRSGYWNRGLATEGSQPDPARQRGVETRGREDRHDA
jgi:hypothetical protein